MNVSPIKLQLLGYHTPNLSLNITPAKALSLTPVLKGDRGERGLKGEDGNSSSQPLQVFVQDMQPQTVEGQPWIWWETFGGATVDYHVFDGVI